MELLGRFELPTSSLPKWLAVVFTGSIHACESLINIVYTVFIGLFVFLLLMDFCSVFCPMLEGLLEADCGFLLVYMIWVGEM